MPSVQFGVKTVTKGSVRDIDNRRFADGSAVMRATKRTIDDLVPPRKKLRVNSDKDQGKLAKKAAAAEKKQKRLEESARRASLTETQRKKERADKSRATRARNKAEKQSY
jgi:hypothetical protein